MMEFKGTSVELSSVQLILNKDVNNLHNKWWIHSPKIFRNEKIAKSKFQGKTDGFVVETFVAARHYDNEMKNVVFPMFLLGLVASLSIMIPGEVKIFFNKINPFE